MSPIWKTHAINLTNMLRENKEIQAHLYLEQLMLLPVDIQDMIIEDVSYLNHCDSDTVARIICQYSISAIK